MIRRLPTLLADAGAPQDDPRRHRARTTEDPVPGRNPGAHHQGVTRSQGTSPRSSARNSKRSTSGLVRQRTPWTTSCRSVASPSVFCAARVQGHRHRARSSRGTTPAATTRDCSGRAQGVRALPEAVIEKASTRSKDHDQPRGPRETRPLRRVPPRRRSRKARRRRPIDALYPGGDVGRAPFELITRSVPHWMSSNYSELPEEPKYPTRTDLAPPRTPRRVVRRDQAAPRARPGSHPRSDEERMSGTS